MFTSVDGGAFVDQALSPKGVNVYEGELPGVECLSEIRYYVTASIDGTPFVSPAGAPSNAYSTLAVFDMEVVREEDFDAADEPADWSVQNSRFLVNGSWQHGNPTGVLHGFTLAGPDGDSSPSGAGKAYVTCLGSNGPASGCNVNNGETHLISEALDLSGADSAEITYDRWFYSSHQGDPLRATFLETYVSNDDGVTWVFVHTTGGTSNSWQPASFIVDDFVTPTADVRVRFSGPAYYAYTGAFSGGSDFYGAVILKQLTAAGGASIHYDLNLKKTAFTEGNPMMSAFTWKSF